MKLLESGYAGWKNSWMADVHPDVVARFPPSYIVGKKAEGTEDKELLAESDENVEVKLLESEQEYMYSNPTGIFNLSKPDCPFRTAATY